MHGISLLIVVLLVCLQIATLVSATLVGENHLRVNKQSHLLVQVTAALEEKRRGEAVEGEFDDELLRSSSGTPHAEITLKITSTDVGKSAYGVKAEQKKTIIKHAWHIPIDCRVVGLPSNCNSCQCNSCQ